jgi:hypothetical protein
MYDVIPNALLYNSGTPLWCPKFYDAAEIPISLYLVYMAF